MGMKTGELWTAQTRNRWSAVFSAAAQHVAEVDALVVRASVRVLVSEIKTPPVCSTAAIPELSAYTILFRRSILSTNSGEQAPAAPVLFR
jgi:hypothetical protein